jgi:hypothetical protein
MLHVYNVVWRRNISFLTLNFFLSFCRYLYSRTKDWFGIIVTVYFLNNLSTLTISAKVAFCVLLMCFVTCLPDFMFLLET